MKIIFTGDVSISGSFLNSVEMDRPILDQNIIDIFMDSDIVHINLENPISNQSFRMKKGSSLRAPPEVIKYLLAYNINVCNLANNHIMDCGERGLLDTISLLNNNNIIHYYGVGPFKKYIVIEKKDVSIALISSCSNDGPVFNNNNNNNGVAPYHFNLTEIKEIVDDIKKNTNADHIIYNYHGGTEFNIIPEPKRRLFFKSLIDMGVDLVIGHHAHVPQGVEYVNSSIIVYGLGNFIFDTNYQRSHPFTSESYFVQIIIDDGVVKIKKFFYSMDLENGRVIINTKHSKLEESIKKSEINFRSRQSYIKAWEKDCYRVYLEPLIKSIKVFNTRRHITTGSYNKNVLKRNKYNIFPKILSLMMSFANDLLNENRRSYVIGSAMYIFRNMINRIL